MHIEDLEISWRIGDRHFTIQLDPDGSPSVAGAPLQETERRLSRNGRRGQLWTEEEEGRVRAAHAAGVEAGELAQQLGRSPGAVRARLVWLGLVDPETETLRYPVRPRVTAPDGGTAPA